MHASLNSLCIPLSVLPVVDITPLSNKRRNYNRENEICAEALNRSFTVSKFCNIILGSRRVASVTNVPLAVLAKSFDLHKINKLKMPYNLFF